MRITWCEEFSADSFSPDQNHCCTDNTNDIFLLLNVHFFFPFYNQSVRQDFRSHLSAFLGFSSFMDVGIGISGLRLSRHFRRVRWRTDSVASRSRQRGRFHTFGFLRDPWGRAPW